MYGMLLFFGVVRIGQEIIPKGSFNGAIVTPTGLITKL